MICEFSGALVLWCSGALVLHALVKAFYLTTELNLPEKKEVPRSPRDRDPESPRVSTPLRQQCDLSFRIFVSSCIIIMSSDEKNDSAKSDVNELKEEEEEEEEEDDDEKSEHVNVFEQTILEGKRQRKSLEVFEPEDFKDESQKHTFANLIVKQGRGNKFSEIPDILSNIEKVPLTDPILEAAHKFLFGGVGGAKGGVVKKLIKSQMLEFSGYVPLEVSKDVEQKMTVSKFVVDLVYNSCGMTAGFLRLDIQK